MIDLPDTTYNEEKDGMIPIVAGVYPAHISGLDSRDLTTKAGEQKVFNITFLVPKEVENTQVSKMVKNGQGELTQAIDDGGQPITIPASFMAGKRFNSVGIWLTPNPDEGQGWKNRKYKEFFENVGVTFPTNKKGDTLLAEVEGEDVIGYPCFIKLGQEHYTKDGEERSVWKAFEVFPWAAGEKLSQDEVDGDDLPF